MHWIQTELRVLVLFSFKEKRFFFSKKNLKIETRSWSFSCTLYVQKEQEPSAKEWLLSGDVKATFRAQVLHILKMGGSFCWEPCFCSCGRIYKTSLLQYDKDDKMTNLYFSKHLQIIGQSHMQGYSLSINDLTAFARVRWNFDILERGSECFSVTSNIYLSFSF